MVAGKRLHSAKHVVALWRCGNGTDLATPALIVATIHYRQGAKKIIYVPPARTRHCC